MLSKIPYSMNKKIDVFKKRAFCNGTGVFFVMDGCTQHDVFPSLCHQHVVSIPQFQLFNIFARWGDTQICGQLCI